MKNIIFFFIFLLGNCLQTTAQTMPVNRKYDMGYLATVFTGVYPTDSCLYVKGVMTDSLFRAGSVFCKFGLDGQLIWVKELVDSSKIIDSWRPKIIQNRAGNFLVVGYLVDPEPACFLAEFSSQGALVRFQQFKSPYFPNDKHIVPTCILEKEGGGYYLGGVVGPYTGKGILLVELNEDLSIKWLKTYGGDLRESLRSLLVDQDGGLILGATQYNNFINVGIICRKWVFKVDSLGKEEIWSWKHPVEDHPPLRGWFIHDMLLEPDGSIIGASAISREDTINEFGSELDAYSSLFKLKPDHSLAWETPIGNGFFDACEFNRLLPTPDQMGYIAAGANAGLTVLAKVGNNGDSLWMRNVFFYEVPHPNRGHKIYDLAAAPDGGYWLCGEAKMTIPGEPYQQGWLFRVDEYGCVVPGCHLINSIPANQPDLSEQIKLYPNPASDYLNIYHGGYDFVKGSFRIVDSQGRILRNWTSPANELNTVMPVSDMSAGTYYLQYMEAGEVRISKAFVVI